MRITCETYADWLRRNPDLAARNPGPTTVVEPRAVDGAPTADPRESRRAGRFFVRIESVRRRLTDGPHAICEKWMVDCLTLSHVIPDDSFREINLSVTQRRVGPGEAERTIIEVYELK